MAHKYKLDIWQMGSTATVIDLIDKKSNEVVEQEKISTANGFKNANGTYKALLRLKDKAQEEGETIAGIDAQIKRVIKRLDTYANPPKN